MSLKVLIVSHNLDIHQLVTDIIKIVFKKVAIERAHDINSLEEKLLGDSDEYGLVLLDSDFNDKHVEEAYTILKEKSVALLKRLVVIADKSTVPGEENVLSQHPMLVRPFSLDKFEQITKEVSAS